MRKKLFVQYLPSIIMLVWCFISANYWDELASLKFEPWASILLIFIVFFSHIIVACVATYFVVYTYPKIAEKRSYFQLTLPPAIIYILFNVGFAFSKGSLFSYSDEFWFTILFCVILPLPGLMTVGFVGLSARLGIHMSNRKNQEI